MNGMLGNILNGMCGIDASEVKHGVKGSYLKINFRNIPAVIYLFKVTLETLEKSVKYVQS